MKRDKWDEKVVVEGEGIEPGSVERTVMTKRELYLDLQFIGGDYKQAGKLIRDCPGLRTRWDIDQLDEFCDILDGVGMAGMTSRKAAGLMLEYLEKRGDAGELEYCIQYNTSEYCVMLWLLREAERKEKRASETIEERIERNWKYREWARGKVGEETEEERAERKRRYVEQAKVRLEKKRREREVELARVEKELEGMSLEELEGRAKELGVKLEGE